MTRKVQRTIAGPALTIAATPDREVVVVMLYDEIRVAHVAYTPDEARERAAELIAAAHRAEHPRPARIIRNEPDYREGPEWFDKHNERL